MEKEGIIMSGSAPTIVKIRQLFPNLKGNNRRIAEQLLTSPELLMSKKLNDIANACSCDPAQVIRFCQNLGFKGFSELKNRVARELIPLPVEKEEKRNKGQRITTLRGFDYPVRFYSPQYPDGPIEGRKDYRRTLYWNPNVITDSLGCAHVEFYNNSYSTNFTVTGAGITASGTPYVLDADF